MTPQLTLFDRPRRVSHGITARERTRIVELLNTVPLPEVRARTGRSFMTLIRIAAVMEAV